MLEDKTKHVYLHKGVRLVITSSKIEHEDYVQLMNTTSIAPEFTCKVFCMGYVIGSQNVPPINDINEFK